MADRTEQAGPRAGSQVVKTARGLSGLVLDPFSMMSFSVFRTGVDRDHAIACTTLPESAINSTNLDRDAIGQRGDRQ